MSALAGDKLAQEIEANQSIGPKSATPHIEAPPSTGSIEWRFAKGGVPNGHGYRCCRLLPQWLILSSNQCWRDNGNPAASKPGATKAPGANTRAVRLQGFKGKWARNLRKPSGRRRHRHRSVGASLAATHGQLGSRRCVPGLRFVAASNGSIGSEGVQVRAQTRPTSAPIIS